MPYPSLSLNRNQACNEKSQNLKNAFSHYIINNQIYKLAVWAIARWVIVISIAKDVRTLECEARLILLCTTRQERSNVILSSEIQLNIFGIRNCKHDTSVGWRALINLPCEIVEIHHTRITEEDYQIGFRNVQHLPFQSQEAILFRRADFHDTRSRSKNVDRIDVGQDVLERQLQMRTDLQETIFSSIIIVWHGTMRLENSIYKS